MAKPTPIHARAPGAYTSTKTTTGNSTRRTYPLTPVYDMTPMAFAPSAHGELSEFRLSLDITELVRASTWGRALSLAQDYVMRLRDSSLLSRDFTPCVDKLQTHIDQAAERLKRLAP